MGCKQSNTLRARLLATGLFTYTSADEPGKGYWIKLVGTTYEVLAPSYTWWGSFKYDYLGYIYERGDWWDRERLTKHHKLAGLLPTKHSKLSFEEVLENVPEDIQTKLLFHLNLFTEEIEDESF